MEQCSKRPHTHITPKEIFYFSFLWVHDNATDKNLEMEFRAEFEREKNETIGKHSRALYRKQFSQVCLEYFLCHPVKIGGPGKIVEVDESLVISKRKQIPVDMQTEKRQWYFGGVERGCSVQFLDSCARNIQASRR
ncbi:hypothetical protein DdX_21381 [Ditylenchus destructor]|uniref:Uncharacterized protein n=1 Tax=Ditylenchus destructor TaxID=166010 RepID=A0AAD4MHE9_9BILA|nr:hypothetical protein DdX_21381 [Ditylenchus destructor]